MIIVFVSKKFSNIHSRAHNNFFHLSPASLAAGSVVGAEAAGHEAADGVGAEARGGVPALGLSACRAGYRGDQPDPAGLGELLRGGSLKSVLQLRPRLGGKEDQASHVASPEAPGLRLDDVE